MYKNLHSLPIAVFVTIPLNFIITYIWAVLLEHVEPGFPYISDTGSLPPESCFFSLMLNISALLMASCVYIQYRHVEDILKDKDCGVPERLNISSAWLGAASCFGLSIVACFQESNVLLVHLFGAAVTFIGGTIYFCLQTWFSYRLRQYHLVSPVLFRARVALCVLTLILMPLTFSTAIVAYLQFDGPNKFKWRPRDGGWEFHVVSTASEWIMSIAFCGYILLMSYDFKHINFESPVIKKQHPNLIPLRNNTRA